MSSKNKGIVIGVIVLVNIIIVWTISKQIEERIYDSKIIEHNKEMVRIMNS